MRFLVFCFFKEPLIEFLFFPHCQMKVFRIHETEVKKKIYLYFQHVNISLLAVFVYFFNYWMRVSGKHLTPGT